MISKYKISLLPLLVAFFSGYGNSFFYHPDISQDVEDELEFFNIYVKGEGRFQATGTY
ncbi:hypothetical protein J7E63_28425 [Bacillus sp. ISL-75]|nr:hypothetical protein [Bacillus sp. ISL-75]